MELHLAASVGVWTVTEQQDVAVLQKLQYFMKVSPPHSTLELLYLINQHVGRDESLNHLTLLQAQNCCASLAHGGFLLVLYEITRLKKGILGFISVTIAQKQKQNSNAPLSCNFFLASSENINI